MSPDGGLTVRLTPGSFGSFSEASVDASSVSFWASVYSEIVVVFSGMPERLEVLDDPDRQRVVVPDVDVARDRDRLHRRVA